MKPQHNPSQLEQDLERFLTTLLSSSEGKMNTIQQAVFHTAATIYEIASGQSFTQRVAYWCSLQQTKQQIYCFDPH